jgi:hypothetical protein
MIELLKSKIGRLRIVTFLEGISLLVLVFIGVPFKYWLSNPLLAIFLKETSCVKSKV